MNETVPTSRIAWFFALTFLVTWGAQLPAALAKLGVLAAPVERLVPFVGLGLFGPMVAAMIVSRGEPGGVRGLFARLRGVRAGVGWYLAALLLPGVLLTLGLAVYRLGGGADLGRWFWPPRDPPRIMAMILVPFTEELGWRGYAQPRLAARVGPLKASLVVGAFWGLWHFPMFVLQGVPAALFPASIAYTIAGSVVFTWLCQRSGSLLPMAVVAHLGAHLDNSMASIPGTSVPFVAQLVAYVVLAATLVLVDRAAFAARPAAVAEGERPLGER
jgi:membrane protease YdiL (CAAX protease family)